MIFGPAGGGRDVDDLREGLLRSLPAQLQEKGYKATPLHSMVLSGSFNKLSFDGTRPYRPQLQAPVFAAAQSQGLSGVFVLWVNAKPTTPGTTVDSGALAMGAEKVLYISARLELYAPSGEPLCIHEAFAEEMDSVKMTGGEKIVVTYRVVSGTELADQLTRRALILVPARSDGGPKRSP